MAKTSVKKTPVKRTPAPRKKPVKTTLTTADLVLNVTGGGETPPCCDECDPCIGQLATGEWGIPYTDSAGAKRCLKGQENKLLVGGEDGPEWRNP